MNPNENTPQVPQTPQHPVSTPIPNPTPSVVTPTVSVSGTPSVATPGVTSAPAPSAVAPVVIPAFPMPPVVAGTPQATVQVPQPTIPAVPVNSVPPVSNPVPAPMAPVVAPNVPVVQTAPTIPAPQPVPVVAQPVVAAQTAAVPVPPTPAAVPTQVPVAQVAATPVSPTPVGGAVPPVPGTPPPVIIKKGSNISPIKFIIGCGLFGFVIVGIISFILYLAIQNPSQFKGIIGIEGIKTGLKLFTGLFIGILILTGFILSIFNLYKLINQKNEGKAKYVIGLIFGLLLLGGSIYGGIVSFNKINEMISTAGNPSMMTAYITFKDGEKAVGTGFPVIAPTKVTYRLNTAIFERQIQMSFANEEIKSVYFDCGNGTQKLPYNNQQKQFVGQCLYMKKADYQTYFIWNLTNKNTKVARELISTGMVFKVNSEISIRPSNGELTFNDAKNEIIIGKAPTKLYFDSTKLFTDFQLNEYAIQWDLNGDGTFDKSNITTFSHQFRDPKVQSIYYTLPGLKPNHIYQIDMRLLQSEVPICVLDVRETTKNKTTYTITASFDNQQVRINSYMYKIKNLATDKFVGNAITNKKQQFDFDFEQQGSYTIYLDYVTEDGKKGSCESDTVEIGASSFDVAYKWMYQAPDAKNWSPLTQQGTAVLSGETITITELPMKLLLQVDSIIPHTETTNLLVKLDDQIIQTPNGKDYEIIVRDASHREIRIEVTDPVTQASIVLIFPLNISQADILGKLSVFPTNVGVSPFTVTLDASATVLTDKDDEIIYFSWDYGNGETTKNSSQARTQHTYTYNESMITNGFYPMVTITTKKGKSASFGLEHPILVTKPTIAAAISIDSHPAQIANAYDQVQFSLDTDGTPVKIVWDFGNGSTIECEDRSCASVPMIFETAGTYEITATITYKDLNMTTATTKLIVK